MSDSERALKEIADFLQELANDKRLADMKTVMGWPIQQKAAEYARDAKQAIDEVRHLKHK